LERLRGITLSASEHPGLLSDEEVWNRAHKLGELLFKIASIVILMGFSSQNSDIFDAVKHSVFLCYIPEYPEGNLAAGKFRKLPENSCD